MRIGDGSRSEYYERVRGNKCSARHYISLIWEEHPLEAHAQYVRGHSASQEVPDAPATDPGPEQDDMESSGASGTGVSGCSFHSQPVDQMSINEAKRAVARLRWASATAAVMRSAAMVRDAQILADKTAHGIDRLAAAVALEMRLENHEHKTILVQYLQKKAAGQYTSLWDRLQTELFITGERIFEFCTPAEIGEHKLYFTQIFLLTTFVLFFFMAGEFSMYMLVTQLSSVDSCLLTQDEDSWGPIHFKHWVFAAGEWCFGRFSGKDWSFNKTFLVRWGARYGPELKAGEGWRWVTSMFLHQSFMHLLSNTLLFYALSWQMEQKFGAPRIFVVWVIAVFGGNFFSMAFEDPCLAVVGSSGGVFGLMGLFLADLIMNFKTIPRPILRSIFIAAFLVFFFATVASIPNGTSHLSHIGGFICGLFPAFLFLPRLGSERWEAWLPIVGGIVLVAVFVSLPSYIYGSRFKELDCQ